MINEQELLNRYVQTGCEKSFNALVERHAGMVYAVAYQRTEDREMAKEVAQNVFLALARKASQLRVKTSLAAWLHRVTALEAAAMQRSERRRRRRHETLATMKEIESTEPLAHSENLSLLDEAVQKLRAGDRDLLFRRFYEEMSFAEIARHYDIAEATGRKRISRLLKKLSTLMNRRGVSVSVVALGATMTAHWSKAAPTGLAHSLSQTALSGLVGTTSSNLTLLTTIMTTKLTAISLVALGAAFPLTIQWAHSKRDASTEPTQINQVEMGAQSLDAARAVKAPQQASTSEFNLEALARELRRLPLPDGSFKRELQLELLMHTLTESQVIQVVDLLREAPNAAALSRIATALFSRWAEYDPQAAAMMALQFGDLRYSAQGGVLSTWAQRDPNAALSFLEESVLSNGDQAELMISHKLLERVIHITGDRASALERMEALADTNLSRTMTNRLLTTWAKSEPDEAFNWIQAKEDYGSRNRYTQDLLHELALSKPKKTFELALSLDQPKLREEAVRWTLMQWAGQEAREAYLALPDTIRTEHLTNNTVPFLARDAETAFEMANELPEGFHRNHFLFHGVRKLTAETPGEAASQALAIPDESTRIKALEYVGKQWLEADRATAQSWFERESGLPEQKLRELLKGDSK